MVINRFAVFIASIFLLVLFNKIFSKEIFNTFWSHVLSNKFFIKRFCLDFHECIVYLALTLKRPYVLVQKVGMLRWSFTDH